MYTKQNRRYTPFVPPPPRRFSRGVGSSYSVEAEYPVFSASQSLVAPRAQQPKRLTTLVLRPHTSLRISAFLRKTRPFTREIARIVNSTHNARLTEGHKTGYPHSCHHELSKAAKAAASLISTRRGLIGCWHRKQNIFFRHERAWMSVDGTFAP